MSLYRVRFDTYGLMCDDHKEYRWENVKPGPWAQMVRVHGSAGTCRLTQGHEWCHCPPVRRHITEMWCDAASSDHAIAQAMIRYGKHIEIRWVKRGLNPKTPVTERKWDAFITRRQMEHVNELVRQGVHHGAQGNGSRPETDTM